MTLKQNEQFAGAIYIVDDDPMLVAALQSLLPLIGASKIRTFASGDDFIRYLPQAAGGCVLLDLHMPGASGLDVLRASEGRFHDLAFVILSGEGLLASAVEAMKLGAIDYLEKPYDPDRLRHVIAHAFQYLGQNADRNRARDEARAILARLSPRERDVLLGLVEGKPHKIIAHELKLSFRTIEIYRAKLMEKLGVRSLSDALHLAFAAGLRHKTDTEGDAADRADAGVEDGNATP